MLCQIRRFQLRNTLKLSNKKNTFFKTKKIFYSILCGFSHVYVHKKDLQPKLKLLIVTLMKLEKEMLFTTGYQEWPKMVENSIISSFLCVWQFITNMFDRPGVVGTVIKNSIVIKSFIH